MNRQDFSVVSELSSPKSKRNQEGSAQGHENILKHWHRTAASHSVGITVGLGGLPAPTYSFGEAIRRANDEPSALQVSGHCAHLSCDKHGAGDAQSLRGKGRQEEGTGQHHRACLCPHEPPSVTWPLLSRGQPWTPFHPSITTPCVISLSSHLICSHHICVHCSVWT